MNCEIKEINLIFDDGENIVLEESFFTNFYISNINNFANEIPYEKLFDTNILYANFFTLKVKKTINEVYNQNIINKIFNKKDISKVILNTSNQKEIVFNIASDIDPFKKDKNNTYNQSFILEDELCLLITPYKLKYKNHLFA
ncbi:MAG: hypothetical protein PHG03_00355 [Bacilli bacterium]|nr:hypothetical protein [Bacilli bacterium]MDD4794998.1 hypothetical protein [Bacilli bacterium]